MGFGIEDSGCELKLLGFCFTVFSSKAQDTVTKMSKERKKPNIDTQETNFIIIQGTLMAIISFFFVAISFTFWGVGFASKKFGPIIVGFIFTSMAILQFNLCMDGIIVGISSLAKKKKWIHDSISIQAMIIDSIEEHDDYAESRQAYYDCKLAFKIPINLTINFEEQIVWAKVSKKIYDKYVGQEVAHIYCSKEDPLTILIDGE